MDVPCQSLQTTRSEVGTEPHAGFKHRAAVTLGDGIEFCSRRAFSGSVFSTLSQEELESLTAGTFQDQVALTGCKTVPLRTFVLDV